MRRGDLCLVNPLNSSSFLSDLSGSVVILCKVSKVRKIMGKEIYTNNSWKDASGDPFHSISPSTGKVVWKGRATTKREIDEVVARATNAFDAWSGMPLQERYTYLERFGEILKYNQDKLAETISQEMGKPRWESKLEVMTMINKITISRESYEKRCETLIKDTSQGKSITRHKPHGVVAVFGPFNFPGHLPNGHIIPALLAGNTVIFKPSELTPLVGQEMISYWEQAHLPPGVLNLVQGGRETGQLLAKHPMIQGLFFTGSYQAGLSLSEEFGHHPEKILALEMGGNNPLVVTQVNDPKAAAYLTLQSAYLSSGQRCTCARRLIVPIGTQQDIYLHTLVEMIKNIQVGYYTDQPEPFMGPVVSARAAQNILDTQENLLSKGATPILKLELRDQALLTPGLLDVTEVEREDREIFGPLLQLIRVQNLSEAVHEANRTKYGLVAGLLSNNSDDYSYFYQHVRAGVINWNSATTGASSAAPFGGVGCSGNHRPSAFYAADYCAYPVVSQEDNTLKVPSTLFPGTKLT